MRPVKTEVEDDGRARPWPDLSPAHLYRSGGFVIGGLVIRGLVIDDKRDEQTADRRTQEHP